MPLIINDKNIKFLSGPNRMYYLVSNMDYPSLILFGDVHGSDKNQCDENEYKLYSDEFLKLLDDLPYGVNLFVETWLRRKDYSPNEATFKHFRSDVFSSTKQLIPALTFPRIACYIKDLRGTELYSKYCPTKNIKWHNIDARFSENLEYKKGKYTSKKVYTEFKTFSAFNELEKIIKRYYEEKPLNKAFFENDVFQDLSFKRYIEGFSMLQRFIDIDNPKNIFNALLEDNNSIINKQLQKINLNPTKTLFSTFYKKQFLEKYELYKPEYLNNFISEIILYLETEDNIYIENLQKMLDNKEQIEDGWTIHNLIVDGFMTLMKLTSIILDLYFTFRMLKSDYGELTIGILGNEHAENITVFLTEYLKIYKIKEQVIGDYTGNRDTSQRCLKMPDINLNIINKVSTEASTLIPSFKISISKRRGSRKASRRKTSKQRGSRRKTSRRKTSRRKI